MNLVLIFFYLAHKIRDKIVDSVEGEPTDKNFQEVVALAKEVGVEISVADIKNYLESQDKNSEELTNGELEMVAGGKHKWRSIG